jgi:DNA polymerase (family 10)
MSNQDLAQIFENIADLLQIKGESIHRILAYRNAGETLRELPRELSALQAEGKLTEIPGIGKTLAEKIEEWLTTGRLDFYERLTQEVPPSLLEVLRVNGVGPKRAKLFWEQRGITTLAQLQAAAQAGQLRDLAGMGLKSEQKIIEGIQALSRGAERIPLGVALPIARAILDDLLTLPQALRGDVAGSLRRFRPTIGDIDLLIASHEPDPIMARFVARPDVARVLGHGDKKSSIQLLNGAQVDVRVLPPERYGTGLAYFTGSQAHNIRMRELALKQGLSLSEHSFTYTDGREGEILCATEEEVFAVLGLPWIPPELREDKGELEAAQDGSLPTLITQDAIQADLHMHTTWSDGKQSLREMALSAKERGLRYIVITDHSRSLGVANGLSIERLRQQAAEVRALDAEFGAEFHVLHGSEIEIKADGTLDYPDEVLAELDFVIASLHTSLRQPRAEITARLLHAIRNPHVDMIAHPRGQLIPQRDPADLDMDAVFEAALQHQTVLEMNANPSRLDLDAIHARRAGDLGLKLAINTDAHSTSDLDLLSYGIGTARRAWLKAEQIINTWDYARFRAWLAGRNL